MTEYQSTDSTKPQGSPGTLQQFWQYHLDSWKKTGLSQTEYCRQKGLSRHRFTYWKTKLFKKEQPVEFVMLPANVPEREIPYFKGELAPSLKLMVGSRFTVEIPDHFSRPTLEKVLLTLQEV